MSMLRWYSAFNQFLCTFSPKNDFPKQIDRTCGWYYNGAYKNVCIDSRTTYSSTPWLISGHFGPNISVAVVEDIQYIVVILRGEKLSTANGSVNGNLGIFRSIGAQNLANISILDTFSHGWTRVFIIRNTNRQVGLAAILRGQPSFFDQQFGRYENLP